MILPRRATLGLRLREASNETKRMSQFQLLLSRTPERPLLIQKVALRNQQTFK